MTPVFAPSVEGNGGCLRFRFAPSPNGYLHLGHALSAITGHDWARRVGGRFLLRIEDIDVARARPEYVAAITEDLTWLGVTWDGPVIRQSEHFDIYAEAAARLRAFGVLYPCFATRAEIEAAADGRKDPDGAPLYRGHHGGLPAQVTRDRIAGGERCASRIDMARALAVLGERHADISYVSIDEKGRETLVAARPERWGDAVIVRKDCAASYHLAVVVDDARQGVTHVTRGADLEAATDIHRVLQMLLDLPAPLYHHHRLVTDATGEKLAKSRASRALRDLRADGWTAADVRRELAIQPR